MMVRKAFRYRLYPNHVQRGSLVVQFGHARFVYNWGLATRKASYKDHHNGLGFYALKRMLPGLKCRFPWLRDADSQVLQAKLEDLGRAYQNFFEKRATYPKLKSKKAQQSIRYPQRFQFNDSHIYFPKIGWVKTVFHRPLEGCPKHVTVSKTKNGDYYVSIQCEVELPVSINNGSAVGVDLGLTHFAILSTGEKVEHPQLLRRAERTLTRCHRQLSRKQRGSRNREKARGRLARHYEKVARQRGDFLHKLSRRLVNDHSLVKIENLNVCGMLKNHRLAKSVADSGWGTFGRMCAYKATWYGSAVRRIDRFYPSSKTCHVCDFVNNKLQLHHRFWTCPNCGTEHDRDKNAAMTILNFPTVGATESHAWGDCVSHVAVMSRATVVEPRNPKSFKPLVAHSPNKVPAFR